MNQKRNPLETVTSFLWRIRWWLLGAGLLTLFVSHFYSDMATTVRYGMAFIKSILNGSVRSFYGDHYSIPAEEPYFWSGSAMYEWPVLLLIGLWNLPLVIAEHFGIQPLMHPGFLMWSKGLTVLFGAITVVLTAKISSMVGCSRQEQKLVTFHLASSCLVIFPILITTQIDIIALVFSLLAVKAYMEKKDRAFFLWSVVSVIFKQFFFVVYVSLILLREKKILKALVKFLLPFLAILVLRILIPFASGVDGSGVIGLVDTLNGAMPVSYYPVSLMLILLLCFWYWCYFYESEKVTPQTVLWVCLMSCAIFFGPSKPFHYWIILMTPFMTLCIMQSKISRTVGILLESAVSCSGLAMAMLRFPAGFDFRTIGPMLPSQIFGVVPEDRILFTWVDILKETPVLFDVLGSLCSSFFIAGLLLLCYHTCPLRKQKVQKEPENLRGLLLFRGFVMMCECLIPLAFYILMIKMLF